MKNKMNKIAKIREDSFTEIRPLPAVSRGLGARCAVRAQRDMRELCCAAARSTVNINRRVINEKLSGLLRSLSVGRSASGSSGRVAAASAPRRSFGSIIRLRELSDRRISVNLSRRARTRRSYASPSAYVRTPFHPRLGRRFL